MNPHRIGGSATLLLVASLVGCGSEPPDAPLTVTLERGGPLSDSPSSFLVEITRDGDAAPVAASASPAVTVGPDGLVLMTEGLAAGRYTLTAAQVGCGMNGGSCPGDPDSPEFGTAPIWSCRTEFSAESGAPVDVRISQGIGEPRTDDADCRVAG